MRIQLDLNHCRVRVCDGARQRELFKQRAWQRVSGSNLTASFFSEPLPLTSKRVVLLAVSYAMRDSPGVIAKVPRPSCQVIVGVPTSLFQRLARWLSVLLAGVSALGLIFSGSVAVAAATKSARVTVLRANARWAVGLSVQGAVGRFRCWEVYVQHHAPRLVLLRLSRPKTTLAPVPSMPYGTVNDAMHQRAAQ